MCRIRVSFGQRPDVCVVSDLSQPRTLADIARMVRNDGRGRQLRRLQAPGAGLKWQDEWGRDFRTAENLTQLPASPCKLSNSNCVPASLICNLSLAFARSTTIPGRGTGPMHMSDDAVDFSFLAGSEVPVWYLKAGETIFNEGDPGNRALCRSERACGNSTRQPP